MNEIYVNVTPANPDAPKPYYKDVNAIQIHASYDKGKGYYAVVYPATVKPNGMVSLNLMLGAGGDNRKLLFGAKRLDRNKLKSFEKLVASQVIEQKGEAWDLIQWQLAEGDLRLTGEVDIPAELRPAV